jgi:hopanoid biosynthesis associated RND transporter like protein HpnN
LVTSPAARLGSACARLTAACARHARWVVAGVLVATVLLGWLAVTRLDVDTGTETMIDADVPFRRNEIAYATAFPQAADQIVVVVDAGRPADAENAAERIAVALAARTDRFAAVRRPDALPFDNATGVLFLPRASVAGLADRLVAAQPLLAPLAADPSLVGLAAAIDLLAEGAARGAITAEALDKPLGAIAATVESVLAGRPEPLAWDDFLAGGLVPEDPRGSRRLILLNPILEPGELARGSIALATARDIIGGLALGAGVRTRFTGPLALDAEELASVASGAEFGLVASFVMVGLLLALALRSTRLVVAGLITLVVGLVWTTAFAALAVGTLNLISVAFGIMFIGIAVDFGLQFAVRYGAEPAADALDGVARAGRSAGGAMTLAAAATASGFLAFLPTDFRGVAELGLIAGVGMVVALVFNLTLLPALIVLFGAPRRSGARATPRLADLDAALAVHHRSILAMMAVLGLAGAAALPFVRFDVDPLNLKDPASESVRALRDLLADPLVAPYGLDVPVPMAEAAELAARLAQVPEVGSVRSLGDLLPADQDAKIMILSDAAFILGPTLTPPAIAEPPTPEAVVAALRRTASRLVAVPDAAEATSLARLANAFDAAADRGPALVPALANALVGGVPDLLAGVRELLAVGPVDAAMLPEAAVRDWRSGDTARLVVQPAATAPDNATLARFVHAVWAVAPRATGMAAAVVASARVVVDAFLTATALALLAIMVMLALVLRRVGDVLLVLAPLALAALMTFGEAVALGMPINFANIIALPLLLGIGVSFPIYLVLGWRAGVEGFVQTPTARAVLFSALTTAAAFGTLAVSPHPGTAAMGTLLLLAVGNLLIANLIALPALLAMLRRA